MKFEAGQVVKGLVFKLTPQAMIFGKVVDEDGPLPGVSVVARRWAFANGKKLLQVEENQNSRADGSFVMGNLPAGRYYLSAEIQHSSYANATEQAGNKNPQEVYLKTYFPSALDTASATLLEVAPGAELRGIDIHIRRGHVFEIRGKIKIKPGGAVRGEVVSYASLSLTPKGAMGESRLNPGTAEVDGAGEFLFKNVAPGAYVIQTQNAMVEGTQLMGRVEVTISDRNLENVVVPLNPGLEIRGLFETEGADPAARNAGAGWSPSVQFRGDGEFPPNAGDYAQAKDDGTFRMQDIYPALVRVNVFGLPENTYVKSIDFGGRDVTGKDLDLTSGSGGEMKIVLSPNAAEVTGIAHDASGKPALGAIVQICDKDGAIAKTANTDWTGTFDVKGLAPGEYKALAWEDAGDGIISDPDFRKSFEIRAAVVKLAEKAHGKIDLVLIAKDTMEIEAAKIR